MATNPTIKFGTDGWRAVIARDFTFDNLNLVTQATARWIREEKVTKEGVVIGHDGRFLGREFSEYVASIFAAMDIPVRMADSIAPTPAVSWAAMTHNAVGIVITASHNPPEYNGFKIKAPFGGPATPAQIEAVERRIPSSDPTFRPKSYRDYLHTGQIREIPLTETFLGVIRKAIDLEAIWKSGITIAHDAMFGASAGLIKALLPDQVVELHGGFNPSFLGQAPEPIEKNLGELSRLIIQKKCAVGLANDGDADRIGMYDEHGVFVNSHLILSLLVKYLSQEKGLTGTIVKTFSTTTMLDKQAAKYGLPILTTPIGFKYVAEKIVEGDVIVGGEESGGLAVKGHIPERDGIYIGLLITEMMVKSGKTLSQLVQDLYDEFGYHATYREDIHTSEEKKNAMMEACKGKRIHTIAGKKVVDWGFTDGVKHHMEDGSWLLVRPSGTEPVLRIYSEAGSDQEAVDLVKDAVSMVESPRY